ncbi:hypothetical protein D030_3398B, partial [Vibrio parahaemolyticus AQ3810]
LVILAGASSLCFDKSIREIGPFRSISLYTRPALTCLI